MATYLSKIYYPADGLTRDFSIPFPYIDKSHIKVYKNGVLSTDHTWVTSAQIQWPSNLTASTIVLIQRVTPQAVLVNWTDGAFLKSVDLNRQARQALYLCQEAIDVFVDADPINAGIVGMLDALTAAAAQNAIVAAGLANTGQAFVIGDGAATSFNISHAFNTATITVAVYNVATGAMVFPDVTYNANKTITVSFSAAPTAGSRRVVIVGVP